MVLGLDRKREIMRCVNMHGGRNYVKGAHVEGEIVALVGGVGAIRHLVVRDERGVAQWRYTV